MISCDIHENKWKRIRAGAERLGLTCISTRTMDARRPDADLVGAMDVVLADVPCSGLGVIRKKPEIRFKDPAELARLPAIQRDILTGLGAVREARRRAGIFHVHGARAGERGRGARFSAHASGVFCRGIFAAAAGGGHGGRYVHLLAAGTRHGRIFCL